MGLDLVCFCFSIYKEDVKEMIVLSCLVFLEMLSVVH